MCTGIRFTDGQGNMYFGRNLDWSCGYGEHVVITPTGWSPNSPFGAVSEIGRPVYGMGIVAELSSYGSGSGMRGIPGDCYSPSRFVRAAYHNAFYPLKDTEDENVSRLFHTLGSVSMVDGAAKMLDGAYEITVYTGGLSTRTNTYYFNTYDDPAIRSVALSDYDTSGTELVEVDCR